MEYGDARPLIVLQQHTVVRSAMWDLKLFVNKKTKQYKEKNEGTYILFTPCSNLFEPFHASEKDLVLLSSAPLSAVNIINCVQCHRIFVAAGKNLTSAAVRITDRLNVILFRDKMPPAGPVARDSTSQRCSVPLPGFSFFNKLSVQ